MFFFFLSSLISPRDGVEDAHGWTSVSSKKKEEKKTPNTAAWHVPSDKVHAPVCTPPGRLRSCCRRRTTPFTVSAFTRS